jgi:excisionase family DNA binding protein
MSLQGTNKGGIVEYTLTVTQVAKMLGRSEGTVRAWADNGKLKSIRLGPHGVRYFERQDVERAKLDHELGEVWRQVPLRRPRAKVLPMPEAEPVQENRDKAWLLHLKQLRARR